MPAIDSASPKAAYTERSCQSGPERRVQRLRFDLEIAWVAFLSLRPSFGEVGDGEEGKNKSVHVAFDIPFWQWPNLAAPSRYFPLASRPYRPISGLTDHRIFAFPRKAERITPKGLQLN